MKKLTFIFIFILFFFISCKKSNNESLDYEIKYSEYDNGIIINGVSNKRVENITIPKRIDGIDKDVTIIEYNAFKDMKNLKSITLPDSIIKIYDNAFYNCYNLESINLNDNIIYLGKKAFYNCKKLDNIDLPEIETIEEGLFYNCIGLNNLILDPNTITINDNAFYNCINLSNIDLSNILNVGQSSFYNCKLINNIPSTLINIGDYAFYGCNSINSVILSENLEYIGNNSFGKCNNIYTFVNNSLLNDDFIKEASINVITNKIELNGLIFKYEALGYYLVSYIGSDIDVILPEKVNDSYYEINEYAFYDSKCINLVLNENIKKVNDYAFSYSNIESIDIPDKYNNISALAFYNVNSKLLNTSNNITYLKSSDNDYKYAISSSLHNKNLKLNDSCEYILNNAFKNNTSIEKFNAGINLLSIGEYAFYYASNLKDIKFNSKLESIGRYAFSRTSIENIKLPDSVINLDNYVFVNNSKLKSIYIGNNINYLPSSLANNSEFLQIVFHNSVKTISNNSINLSDVNVFFIGNEEEYKEISIGYNNTTFTKTENIYYYSETKPLTSGNYFYLDNDEIKIWE